MHKCRGKKINKYEGRKGTFIKPNSANIQNTDQDSGKE